MPKAAIFVISLLICSFFSVPANGFLAGDLVHQNSQEFPTGKLESGILQIPESALSQNNYKRYLIFGPGHSDVTKNSIYSINSDNGFFSVSVLHENAIPLLQSRGYKIIEDLKVDLHSEKLEITDASRIGKITGSEHANDQFKYTGKGIKIAIVDTGVDFSNPDIQQSLARDNNNFPIMLDSDGQGIVLTNATFVANVDKDGLMRNYTKDIPKGITSKVYTTKDGVFLDINQKDKGTVLQIYNSFFPQAGTSPIFNGTLGNDMKIGKDNRDYIKSKSGIYRLGAIYQGGLEGPLTRIQVVPVLVVDSKTSGIYDTIIADMSTSWKDYTRFDLPKGQKPNYDFDFTDEKPIILGGKNEFLLYDFNKDGKNDYSAGTIGARVVDVYGTIQNKSSAIDPKIKAVNGTLLVPMDPKGTYFGIMSDFMGHGTSSAASIVSKGIQEYDIYNNTKKFTIKGVAPDATIVPVKSLWLGDSVYAWLWLAGFDSQGTSWKYDGFPRVDIISNSWGISNFPILQSQPGLDILSQVINILSTPQSVDSSYPGITIISSAGNSGPGYGTIGTPNASPFGIAVGATTNNVFVGYGPFNGQPRFGNTTEYMNDVVDFSSRGPGIIGDVKPDLMSIGAHGFTPSSVIKMKKDSKTEPFSLFGGTSMAAPLVSGTAALLIQSMKENKINYDPFVIKNILMSTATDIENDPFTQGAGLANITTAIKFVKGENGIFVVSNDASYRNLKNILDESLKTISSTSFGIERFTLPNKVFKQTGWFAGQLKPGERSSATFTIQNPGNTPIEVQIIPQTMKLLKTTQMSALTEPHQKDPILNKKGVYSPNYVKFSDIQPHNELGSFYDEKNSIPKDASLLVMNLNFPFDSFMNKTVKTYADDMKISSLYVYDWTDQNNDTKISSDELSMVNRGGSWGTVQEVRVSEPSSKFSNTPLVGVYPVPTRYSYWLGDTTKNSTSMNYTLTANYYGKENWNVVWTNTDKLQVPPKSSKEITATIVVPPNYHTGVYQGFLKFQSSNHTVNAPVSFVVKQDIPQKDTVISLSGKNSDDVLYGNGYLKGSFDMVNRYMAGDWRQYYFDIDDPSINVGAIEISWKDKDSNIAAFASDPQGRIIATNVPSGVFGHFMGWASIDWLGTTPFSQGGGFFPVKNKNETSTVLLIPINQTGTYGLLLHSTLFGGKTITEPIKINSKFTSITPDVKLPEITLDIPKFINNEFKISPKISNENLIDSKYFLDGVQTDLEEINLHDLSDGHHELQINLLGISGQNITKNFEFYLDNSLPSISINAPKNFTKVANSLQIDFDVSDASSSELHTSILLPNGQTVEDQKSFTLDTSGLSNGNYEVIISANDQAQNTIHSVIKFTVDHTITDNLKSTGNGINNFSLIIGIVIGLGIGIGIVIVITKNMKKS